MTAYWLLFLVPVFASITNAHPDRSSAQRLFWGLSALIAVLMIGFRFHVGGDWNNYLRILNWVTYSDTIFLSGATSDIGYVALNAVMAAIGADIYGINLVCGLIFVYGLMVFARQQPLPWLALAVAIPYLTVVVAMGYTRQSVALGFLFWGLAQLQEGRWKRYVVAILAGALFHKTVVLCLPFALLGQERLMAIRWLPMAAVTGAAAAAFLGEHYEALLANYVEAGMQSSGGPIRVGLNLLPALILLLFWNRWQAAFGKDGPWRLMALMTMAAMALVPVASTAVDRMALYLAPLQLVVWARLPLLFATVRGRTYMITAILALYATVMFVWLNYGTHARYWVPYRSVLFQ